MVGEGGGGERLGREGEERENQRVGTGSTVPCDCTCTCVLTNTRPHQLRWSDRECDHYTPCMCSTGGWEDKHCP